MQELDKLGKDESDEGYGLSPYEIKEVFLIRHTWYETTILSLCARKNVPLEVINLIIERAGRESLCVVNCKRWDWIPMQNAIIHKAEPVVVKALIPTLEDCSVKSSQYSDYHICASNNPTDKKQYEKITFQPDYHYRNPLHWSAYYDAPLETIDALKKACTEVTLRQKDHCDHEPYKVRDIYICVKKYMI